MPDDVVWQALTLNSVDSQFLEMRAFAVAEIARVFRVPPIFLQDYGRSTWSNSESMGQQFLTYCLMPWVKRWEGEIRLKLFTPDERNEFFAQFLTDDLLRADFDARMDGYSKAITARILNPNEARAAENRPPYAGGEKFENPNTAA
jgi:HK97 family phage portal protein